tara:strand:- start:2113 stop:3048 length:936 start_codon:yes stop_codon:yes gene_type:complete
MDIKESKKKTKALTQKTNDIYGMIKSRSDAFQSVLPMNSNTQQFVNACLIAVQSNNKLQQCNPKSLIKAMMESARFGLEPNSPLMEAALVPYGKDVQFLIEYRGMLKLAWNSGMIKMIDADVICENDDYEYVKGYNPNFYHKPLVTGERGEPIAYYAYAKLNNGGDTLCLMSKQEIIDHMKKFAKGYNSSSSPWKSNFDAMAKKTVLRQLIDKQLPKSTTKESLILSSAVSNSDKIIDQEAEEIVHPVVLDQDIDYSFKDTAEGLMSEIKMNGNGQQAEDMLLKVTGKKTISNDFSEPTKKEVLERLNNLL